MNCQQGALYAAERRVPHGRAFRDVAEIQEWVDGLRDTWWWRMWYPNVERVEVYPRDNRRGESVGWYERDKRAGAIEMLKVHWNERVVLHELAHVLASARYGSQAHCPWFARVYLELVAVVMGPEAYLPLWTAFNEGGIKHDIEPEARLGAARPMGGAR